MPDIRWVKIPGPGQFRGHGEWRPLAEVKHPDQDEDTLWEWLILTSHLPTFLGTKEELPSE